MIWPFNRTKAKPRRESEREALLLESQRLLTQAADTTQHAAKAIIEGLQTRLDDSIQQFETAAALMKDALLIGDAGHRVEAVNAAAESMFGREEGALEGTMMSALFVLDGVPVADWTALEAALRAGHDGSGRLQALRADGSSFQIDVSTTLLDRKGGSNVTLMLVRDMNEVRGLRELAESRSKHFRVLFDLSSDGILIVQDHLIVAANPAATKMFNACDGLLGITIERLIECAQQDRVVLDMLAGGVPTPTEIAARRADGTPLRLLFSSGSIMWNGKPANLLTIRDVSGFSGLIGRDNAASDMVCVIGANFRIRYANEAFAAFYGETADRIIERDIRSLLRDDELDAFLLNIRGLEPRRPIQRMQLQMHTELGSRLQDWVDSAFFNDKGEAVEFQRNGRDITELLSQLRS